MRAPHDVDNPAERSFIGDPHDFTQCSSEDRFSTGPRPARGQVDADCPFSRTWANGDQRATFEDDASRRGATNATQERQHLVFAPVG